MQLFSSANYYKIPEENVSKMTFIREIYQEISLSVFLKVKFSKSEAKVLPFGAYSILIFNYICQYKPN